MSGKLFLAGGGDENQSKSFDTIFAKHIRPNDKIMYIPIAMNEEATHFTKCFNWFKKTFNRLSIKPEQIMMITELKDITSNLLNKTRAVYIGGGNTFKLLHKIKKTGLDKRLINYYKNGGIIYGGSAGAIILGRTINTCKRSDKNTVNLKDVNGLNLAHDYSIWAHYKQSDDELIKEYVNKYNESLLIIPEDSGVIINEELINCVGNIKIINKQSRTTS